MSAPPVPQTHEEWAQLLSDHFFRPEYENTHVMFYVDRPIVAELAKASEDEAITALAKASASRMRPMSPRRLFEPIKEESRKWKSGGGLDGPPPCLPTLALTVLAATDMRQAGARASNNYYAWFYDLLELAGLEFNERDVEHAYSEAIPVLWEHLRWWLDEEQRGARGFSTVVKDEHWTRLGYADSQTLFRSSDEVKLTQFFRWLELTPGNSLPGHELIEYFRIWSKGRDDLSEGTRVILEEAELPRQLADLLVSAAERWRGLEQDDSGRTLGRLAISLSLAPAELRLVASQPHGYPSEIDVSYGGETLRLECDDEELLDGEDAWYRGLRIPVTGPILGKGIELVADDLIFKLAPRPYYVLQRNETLGRWASVDVIRPSEAAWILAEAPTLPALKEFLVEHAGDGWWELEGAEVVPAGWVLIRDVVIDPIADQVPDAFRRLAPRRGNRLLLSGGLPMPRAQSIYLVGGAPDVQAPASGDESVFYDVDVDGEPAVLESGSTLRLAGHDLKAGPHEVRLGDIHLKFGLIDGGSKVTPEAEEVISHRVSFPEGGPSVALSEDATLEDADAPNGNETKVRGALVVGLDRLEEPSRPVILSAGPAKQYLLGARLGESEVVYRPEPPRWMKRVGLGFRVFEHEPAFPVVWLLGEGRWGKTARRLAALAPTETRPLDDPAKVEAWAEAILASSDAEVAEQDRPAFEALIQQAQKKAHDARG